jgi:Pentapeptide repeats (8 copies)
VIGASGSGKSSVVRAGLIPRLEDLGWRVLDVMKPGTEPMAALRSITQDLYVGDAIVPVASVKPRIPGNEKILLVVDQFEEVFTLGRDRSEQARFIKCLREFAAYEQGRIAVVVTMRADFVEACLADEGLTQAIRSDAVWLGPMTGENLEAAIEQPSIVQGATIQPKLLAQILQDVAEEKNCLPLLEFALSQLWVGKVDSELTLAAYRKLGGVAGALNAHAETIYKQLAAQKREHWVQRVMLRLVRTGEGTKDTRQRQRKSDLLDMGKDIGEKDSIESVIQTLVDGRLLVSDRVENHDVIDLSHEALMQSWQRLTGWRENNREVRRIVDRIEDARREWGEKGKKRRDLLEGRLLKDGKRLLKDAPADVMGVKGFVWKSWWWRRSQFASVMMTPLLVLGVPAEYFWREESVKRDYDRIERLGNSDPGERTAVLNLIGGCWMQKSWSYLSDRMFGNCRSLNNAKLDKVSLVSENLSDANFGYSHLRGSYLNNANLTGTQLEGADLSGAYLISANLSRAHLESANLENVKFECYAYGKNKNIPKCPNIKDITWNKDTNWQGIQGWETVENIPPALRQQLGLKDKKEDGREKKEEGKKPSGQ